MPVISSHWVLGKSVVQQLLTDTWNLVGTIYCVKTSFTLSSSQLTEYKFCSDSLASRKVGSSQSRHPTLLATHRNGHMSHPRSSWDHPPGHCDESKWASESRYVSYFIQVAIMEYQRLGGLEAVWELHHYPNALPPNTILLGWILWILQRHKHSVHNIYQSEFIPRVLYEMRKIWLRYGPGQIDLF